MNGIIGYICIAALYNRLYRYTTEILAKYNFHWENRNKQVSENKFGWRKGKKSFNEESNKYNVIVS